MLGSLNIIDQPGLSTIHRLLLQVQPGHLSSVMGIGIDEPEDDVRVVRANLVRRTLEQAL